MMCRRIASFLLLIPLLIAGVNGCSKRPDKAKSTDLQVVCTFLPVYVMTQNVAEGVPGIRVSILVSPAIGCPHDYSLTPAEAHLIEQADVLVINGLGMEGFLAGIPAAQRPELRTIDASAGLTLVLDESVPEGGAGGKHEAESQQMGTAHPPNPHAWVSPIRAAEMTRYIAAQLADIRPDAADRLLENARIYASALDTLGREFTSLVSAAPNKKIVTFHRAFDYFAQDCGLEVIGVIESEPGVEPSAKNLAELAQRIKQVHPAAIFSEPQYSDKLALMLASETGVPVYSLDPAASGDTDRRAYLRAMASNLEVLRRALSATVAK
jgi:zinc transport system substrate-binding protein